MAKVYFSTQVMNDKMITGLNQTISELQLAINQANSLSIPSNFRFKSFLLELDGELSTIKQNILDITEWCKRCQASYMDTDERLDANIVSLDSPIISSLIGMIK